MSDWNHKTIWEYSHHLLFILITFVLGLILTSLDNNYATSIGYSLIAAATVAVLELIKTFCDKKLSNKIQNIIIDGGIDKIYSNRDITQEYADIVKEVNKSIDICGYSLTGFYESHKDALLKILKEKPYVKLNIYFVNIDSQISKTKEQTEGKPSGTYRKSYEMFKTTFQDFENVEIRSIDYPLSSMIFKVDDVMYIGPQFNSKTSKTSFTIRLTKDKWTYSQFIEELEFMHTNSSKL